MAQLLAFIALTFFSSQAQAAGVLNEYDAVILVVPALRNPGVPDALSRRICDAVTGKLRDSKQFLLKTGVSPLSLGMKSGDAEWTAPVIRQMAAEQEVDLILRVSSSKFAQKYFIVLDLFRPAAALAPDRSVKKMADQQAMVSDSFLKAALDELFAPRSLDVPRGYLDLSMFAGQELYLNGDRIPARANPSKLIGLTVGNHLLSVKISGQDRILNLRIEEGRIIAPSKDQLAAPAQTFEDDAFEDSAPVTAPSNSARSTRRASAWWKSPWPYAIASTLLATAIASYLLLSQGSKEEKEPQYQLSFYPDPQK